MTKDIKSDVVEPNASTPNDTNNVSVGKGKHGGYLFIAPVGTPLPTKYNDTLDAAFENFGYLSEDGIKEAVEIESEEFKDLNGDITQTSTTSNKKTWTFAAEEIKEVVFKTLVGASNVTVDTTNHQIKVSDKAADFTDYSLVFEIVRSNGKAMRKVAPIARITELGEVTYAANELIKFEATWLLKKNTSDLREEALVETD